MVDPRRIVEARNAARVEYVVIGGIAATLHGCPEQTYDLDILYRDTPENREKLLSALRAIDAQWDVPLTAEILRRQPVFALNTRHGDLDIFTAVPGLSDFGAAFQRAALHEIGATPVRVLNLEDLIAAKEAASDPNPRKQSALAFLKALRTERSRL